MTTVESIWLSDALHIPRFAKALERLRLDRGDFWFRIVQAKTNPTSRATKLLYASGVRGGIQGILMTWIGGGGKRRLGVYVDRNHRRKGIGTRLVQAASKLYPGTTLHASSWSTTSLIFWSENAEKLNCIHVQGST